MSRIVEHRDKLRPGFTARCGVTRLVWYEPHSTRESAFRRERRIKEWRRSWKLTLIEESNPTWRDLFGDLVGPSLDLESWFQALDAAAGSNSAALNIRRAEPFDLGPGIRRDERCGEYTPTRSTPPHSL